MIGRVESLHLYPVKGLRGLNLEGTAVARHGIAGDRRWLITDPDGGFLTQRRLAAMAQLDAVATASGLLLRHAGREQAVVVPGTAAARLTVTIWRDRVSAALAGPAADAWLSSALGQPCRLVYMDDEQARPVDPDYARPGDHVGFADGYPLLAASHDSLAVLNHALAVPVPMDRFRPSVTISGLPPWSEDRWRRTRIGRMVFRAPKPCTRCVVITQDQRTGETPEPGEPLRTLGRINRHPSGIVFGANLIPEAPGWLSVGDPVEVLEAARDASGADLLGEGSGRGARHR